MVSIKCHGCGYQWDYSGSKPVTSCPSCNVKTNTGVGPSPDEGPELVEKVKTDTTDVRCDRCGYQWEYSGTAPRTTCPGCERKTRTGVTETPDKVPPHSVEVAEGITRSVDTQTGVVIFNSEDGGIATELLSETKLEIGQITEE
jgi:predicted Zn-ribbon and HTH transcriptional regulator